jgi:hypothetical protein
MKAAVDSFTRFFSVATLIGLWIGFARYGERYYLTIPCEFTGEYYGGGGIFLPTWLWASAFIATSLAIATLIFYIPSARSRPKMLVFHALVVAALAGTIYLWWDSR